jgi:hypothetical protein
MLKAVGGYMLTLIAVGAVNLHVCHMIFLNQLKGRGSFEESL